MRTISIVASLLLGSVSFGAEVPGRTGEEDLRVADVLAQIAMSESNAPSSLSRADSPYPDFKKVTEGMEASKGMFTLWAYPSGTPNKDQEKLLCQIPGSMLGQKFMISTSVSGGGFFTGFPIDQRVVQWELHDKQLVLVEPETDFVVDVSNEVADVVRRTYPDAIRAAVPLVTKSPGGDPVIDFGNLLKSAFADIGWMTWGGINRSLSKWTNKKVFELNVEIGVELAIGNGNPPGSYTKQAVHYSFWKLPASDYRPRIADDRIGYFLTTNQDWSKPTDSRDLFNRYIDRWHLEKRDSSLALCEPKQPIVFYIEKTVPVRFRRAVRDGILEWNKAFEKIGFLNAIEVRQQTNDNEWKDLDPEDMRYSFFRWIVSGAGFAMGPHRSNPFTGQIYDADIIFDDSMIRYFEENAQQMLPTSLVDMKFSDPGWAGFLDEFPAWKRTVRSFDCLDLTDNRRAQMRHKMREHMRKRGCHCCEYTENLKQQMAFSRAILADQPKEVMDRFLYDVVKETVAHEVGHTLGLRHNFKASTIYSLDEIKRKRVEGTATCGSVMDYLPALFLADGTIEGHFSSPVLGPYDFWAIEYGYRPYDHTYKSHNGVVESSKGEMTAKDEQDNSEPKDTNAFDVDKLPAEFLEMLPPEAKEALAAVKLHEDQTESRIQSSDSVPVPVTGEQSMLLDIASRSVEPELVYATDEDATNLGPDPGAARFDMGNDPIEWAQDRLRLINNRLETVLEWSVKDKESWYHLRGTFVQLMFEKIRLFDYVGRYIGGQHFSRAHRGDAIELSPFTLVDPELQRRAIAFTEEHIFADEFYKIPSKLLNHLAPSRWSHHGVNISYSMDFPVHEFIGLLQWWNLVDRFTPNTLRRIYDAETKTDSPNKLTVSEYLQRLQSGCWKEIVDRAQVDAEKPSETSPFLSDIRRSLQREYLSLAETLVRMPPGTIVSADIQAMIKHMLRNLSEDLAWCIATHKADFASQAHMEECKSRIDRMLRPELKEYGLFF